MSRSTLISKNQTENSPPLLQKKSAPKAFDRLRHTSPVGLNNPKYGGSSDPRRKERPRKIKHTSLPVKPIKRKALPIIFIQSTLNNTILTLTDKKGNEVEIY